MDYTKEFSALTDPKRNIESAIAFILKNDRPQKLKVFPEEISSVLAREYLESVRRQVSGKDFVPYIPDSVEKSTLQVLPTSRIKLWQEMLDVRKNLPLTNSKEVVVDDYNVDGNTILIELLFSNGPTLFFLTRYQKVTAWYRNRIHFRKQNGKFVQENGDILALTSYVDAVIADDRCFIINENNFNKIFKYDEVIKNQVDSHRDEISSLGFIDNADEFLSMLDSSKREKQAMAKVLLQNRLQKIKQYKPSYIRKQIEEQEKLAFLRFNDDDTIIVDNESFKAIMGILRGTINLDLITKELNGLDDNE